MLIIDKTIFISQPKKIIISPHLEWIIRNLNIYREEKYFCLSMLEHLFYENSKTI